MVPTRQPVRPLAFALATFALALTFVAGLALALTFPTLTGRVVDEAGIIPEPMRAALTEKLKTLEDKSGVQLVVATVNSLQGEEIEPFANQLFRHWQLGEKDKNNGVLVLVAPKERRVRIEVGYGLEGTLTDALSKIIIANAMTPRFKAGDFGGGIERGIDDVITVLTTDSSEWEKRPELRIERHETAADNWAPFIALALFLLVVFLLIRAPRYAARAPLRGRGVGPTGRWGPGPQGGLPPGRSRWGPGAEYDPRYGRSGWGDFLTCIIWALLSSRRNGGGGGGWGSGSGGFGGDSGGGFSGGGGSSGGGGASGSW